MMKVTRLVFDARHIRHRHSGLARYTASVACALMESKQFEELVLLFDRNEDYTNNPHYQRIQSLFRSEIRAYFVDAPLFRWKHHLKLPKALKAYSNFVYFYPHFDLPFLTPIPSIFVVHDMSPLILPHYFSNLKSIKRLYYRAIILFNLLRPGTKCIADSKSTLEDILRFTHPWFRRKIQLAYLGPFQPLPDPVPQKEKAILERVVGKPYLLYVGDRRPHKNLQRMIDAFCILKAQFGYPGNFVICGSEQTFQFDLDSYTKSMPWIIKTGQVTDASLDQLYRGMDALFFLSEYEGFGLPIVEAAQRGKRVITANVGSTAEIASDSSLKLSPQAPAAEIAAAIAEFLAKQPPEEAMNPAFSWQATVKAIFDEASSALRSPQLGGNLLTDQPFSN